MAATRRDPIRVVPVPMLEDNYAYLIIDENGVCAVVDPAEPQKALDAAAREGVSISTILTTHKHWDHSGGNEALATSLPGLQVVGGALDAVPACTVPVHDGQALRVGEINVTCLHTPGHTRGHITYFCEAQHAKHVFTGDVMFIGGCGKFFEGSAEDMAPSLYEKIGALPDETVLWPGHEYTVSNLAFAAQVEPDNAALLAKAAWARGERQANRVTVPSSVGAEKEHNVFLRCGCSPAVRAAVCLPAGASLVECLGALRALKDSGRLNKL